MNEKSLENFVKRISLDEEKAMKLSESNEKFLRFALKNFVKRTISLDEKKLPESNEKSLGFALENFNYISRWKEGDKVTRVERKIPRIRPKKFRKTISLDEKRKLSESNEKSLENFVKRTTSFEKKLSELNEKSLEFALKNFVKRIISLDEEKAMKLSESNEKFLRFALKNFVKRTIFLDEKKLPESNENP